MTRELGPQNVFMDRFVLEPKVQRVWREPHALWFTLMGVGGGLFVLARLLGLEMELGILFGLPVADLISFLAIAVGGLVLIADLGKPLRFIRALANPRTSWISRGAIADFVFLTLGGLLILPNLELGSAMPFAWLPWEAEATSGFGRTLEIVAMLAAVVVMFYAGQVLAAPKSIPFWNSPAIPLQFLLSSLATSVATIALLEAVAGDEVTAGQLGLLSLFLALLALAIVWHLMTNRSLPGKADSLHRLLRGEHRATYVGGVVVAGTLLPAILGAVGIGLEAAREAIGLAAFALTLPAGYLLRLLTLRVGIYPPVMSMFPTAPVRTG